MRRLLGLILLVSATSVSAAYPKLSEADSRRAMADFGRCVVKGQSAIASRAVVEEWSNVEIHAAGNRLVDPTCVRAAGFVSVMRFKADNLRAELAQQLIQRDPTLDPTAEHLASLSPLQYRQPWPVVTIDDRGRPLNANAIQAQVQGRDARIGLIAGLHVAECVVRANPGAVRPVFATKVASKQEMAALSAIAQQFGLCLPAGKKMAFDRHALRGTLALAYYRLAMAARGTVWGGDPASTKTGQY